MRPLDHILAQARAQHRYRQRQVRDTAQGVELLQGGKNYLSFNSNDYLGLANHPEVIATARRALDTTGVGSGAAHLISGHHRYHHELEQQLAEFTQRPRALLFSTGYMANLAVIASLYQREDSVFQDRLNHASLLDAVKLSDAQLVRYRHQDMDSLRRQLAAHPSEYRLIVSDGVFSMDGDVCDVKTLSQVARENHADVMIDDAHGIGIIGEQGQGTVLTQGCECNDVALLIGTLGKALGTFGAFVAASEEVIETLIQKARPYIYTTALPAAFAAATSCSLRLVQQEGWRREQLQSRIQQFRHGLSQLGLPLSDSTTPIQPLMLGDCETAVRASAALREHGILVSAIRPPTVPENASRLRVTFSAAHTESHIKQLLDALEQAVLPLIRGR